MMGYILTMGYILAMGYILMIHLTMGYIWRWDTFDDGMHLMMGWTLMMGYILMMEFILDKISKH